MAAARPRPRPAGTCDPPVTELPDIPVDPRVRLVARTEFLPPTEFAAQDLGGQGLAEFAGRACYESWDRPNPATASTAAYLTHILEVGHLSVLEHSSVTFYLTGISRSVVHEILRHRHFSYSELSPRHVPDGGLDSVVPTEVAAENPQLAEHFAQTAEAAEQAREAVLTAVGQTTADRARQARQLAQRLLPGATATTLVMTGNYRAWRHFLAVRATDAPDVEIRGLAVAILAVLQREAPAVFSDFRISRLSDGTLMAATPLAGGG